MNVSPPGTAAAAGRLRAMSDEVDQARARLTDPVSTHDTVWREGAARELDHLHVLSRTLHDASAYGTEVGRSSAGPEAASAFAQAADAADEARDELLAARTEMALLHRFAEPLSTPETHAVRAATFATVRDRLALARDDLATATEELRTTANALDAPAHTRTAHAAAARTTQPAQPAPAAEVTAAAHYAPGLLPAHTTWPGRHR